MTPYWIFIIFLISFGLTNYTFAEPVEIEIDWMIEGQDPIVKSVPNSESDIKNDSVTKGQINPSFTNSNSFSNDISEDFITGSGYMIGNREINY